MTLEDRVKYLEDLFFSGGDPNREINISGNVYMLGDRPPNSPTKLFMGKHLGRGFYFFAQERFPGQGSEYWAGMETFENVDPLNPSWGYGYHPLRAWGQNFLLEANGDQVGRNVVVEKIYLQSPAHRNMNTGVFEKPDHYDSFGVPYTASGEQMGGIYYDSRDLGVYITREGDDIVLYNNGRRIVLG